MPVPEGYYWIRELLPGAEWEEATRTIKLPGGPSIPLSATKVEEGRAYVTPAQLATWYATYRPQFQVTPEALKARAEVYRELFRPLWEAQKEQFDFGLKKIQEQAAAQRRLAEAAYEAARSALERKEASAWNAIMQSALRRGLGASPLASYEQRKVAEAYAPEYRQLETQRAAQLANIASQAALASEELALKGKEKEAEWLNNLAKYAYESLVKEFEQAQRQRESFAKLFADMAEQQAKARLEAQELAEQRALKLAQLAWEQQKEAQRLAWEREKASKMTPYQQAYLQLQAARLQQSLNKPPSRAEARDISRANWTARVKEWVDEAWARGGWAKAVEALPEIESHILAYAEDMKRGGMNDKDIEALVDYAYQLVGGAPWEERQLMKKLGYAPPKEEEEGGLWSRIKSWFNRP